MTTAALSSLFIGSLLASTVLPGGVEVLLYAMVESGNYPSLTLLVIATTGNTLGALLTYALGVLLRNGVNRAKKASTTSRTNFIQRLLNRTELSERALYRVRRWGLPCLLFTWLPIIGDPLCIAAGYLRLPFLPSALLIAIGKLARYWVLLWWFGWT